MGSLAVPSIRLKNGIWGQLRECKESRFSRHQGSQPNEAHGQGAGTSSPQDYTLLVKLRRRRDVRDASTRFNLRQKQQ